MDGVVAVIYTRGRALKTAIAFVFVVVAAADQPHENFVFSEEVLPRSNDL